MRRTVPRPSPICSSMPAASFLGFYITFGEYDWLSIAEVPDAETNQLRAVLLERGVILPKRRSPLGSGSTS